MRIYNFLITISLLVSSSCYTASTIIPIYSIKEAEHTMRMHAKNSLIFFDIDDTLMLAADKILRNANIDLHNKFIAALRREIQAEFLINEMFQKGRFFLIEDAHARIIESLVPYAYGVYGFTKRNTGPFIMESSVEDWVFQKLLELDIVFTQSTYTSSNFFNGILYSNRMPKGPALITFLKENNINVSTIIMVDDRLDNLESIAQSLEDWNATHTNTINFIGFHYKAVELIDHKPNWEVVNLQFQHLLQEAEYFSEQQIQAMYGIA